MEDVPRQGQQLWPMMPMSSISHKYKIQKKDLAIALETIKRLGFDAALKWAFDGTCLKLEKDPDCPLATTYLSWSVNLLNDARSTKTEAEEEKLRLLANFYRLLAHKTYWRQRSDGTISAIKDFLQLAPALPSKK